MVELKIVPSRITAVLAALPADAYNKSDFLNFFPRWGLEVTQLKQ